jgi:hypothetical protein
MIMAGIAADTIVNLVKVRFGKNSTPQLRAEQPSDPIGPGRHCDPGLGDHTRERGYAAPPRGPSRQSDIGLAPMSRHLQLTRVRRQRAHW